MHYFFILVQNLFKFNSGYFFSMDMFPVVGNVGDMSPTWHKMSVLSVNFKKNMSLSNTQHFFCRVTCWKCVNCVGHSRSQYGTMYTIFSPTTINTHDQQQDKKWYYLHPKGMALCQKLAPIIAAPVTAPTAASTASVTTIAANNKSSSGEISSGDSARVEERATPQHREIWCCHCLWR